ncbi:translationally-controlled tumor protein, putative [Eimeria necatrix]|uniref:Translationally-controlled tumor protein, putative n=1 Tax=Eimeria necatrix TaxID=51315 RepID=U6MLD3_9EIME|nr:translationally-controlled tumor protein, putative [Eimeria necatrix]CDJ62470.1 translationally-controlled tumor protein, putative [Eimeria necatrix]
MKVYKCVFSGDELCSDSYPHLVPFGDDAFKDVAFEVKGTRVTKAAEDFGIADNSEEGEGGVEDAAETVIDIINAFHLSETSLTKKDFTTYIKGYLKRVMDYLQEHNPSRVEAFKTESAALVKKILGSFDDFQFFMSESNDFEASLVYAYYKDEETAPRFIYLKDGLKEEKY